MPSYDYRCEANDQVIEVNHDMNTTIQTWGELCELAGIATGDTSAETAVKRLITGVSINCTEAPVTLDTILPKNRRKPGSM